MSPNEDDISVQVYEDELLMRRSYIYRMDEDTMGEELFGGRLSCRAYPHADSSWDDTPNSDERDSEGV